MKRIVWITFAFVFLFAGILPSVAEETVGLNSWQPAWQKMALVGNEIYAKGPSASFTGWTNLYAITSGVPQKVTGGISIEEIKTCGDSLALFRREKSILEMIAEADGRTVIEMLDLQTMRKTEWTRYDADNSKVIDSFCVNGALYSVIRETEGFSIVRYTAPGAYEKVYSQEYVSSRMEFPTFYLVDCRKEGNFISSRFDLAIFDYETGRVYRSAEHLCLSPKEGLSEGDIQAVFVYPCFYYLSNASIRCWNVEEQTDATILSLPSGRYECFTWLGDKVMLYSKYQKTADLYDLGTKELLHSYALEMSVGEAIVTQDTLYAMILYDCCVVPLDGGEMTRFSLN